MKALKAPGTLVPDSEENMSWMKGLTGTSEGNPETGNPDPRHVFGSCTRPGDKSCNPDFSGSRLLLIFINEENCIFRIVLIN